MNPGEIDRFPVNQLPARYGNLARSAVYKRMEDLSIKPIKIGGRAFLTGEQLQAMDELHEFIQRGGSSAEFLDLRGIRNGQSPPPPGPGGLVPASDMVGLLANLLGRLQPSNPLSYLEQLEQACQQQWVLSTSEVAKLLGVTPQDIEQYRRGGFTEAGFSFRPSGQRMSGETGWRVEKYQGGHLRY